jgi:hypothetical protein
MKVVTIYTRDNEATAYKFEGEFYVFGCHEPRRDTAKGVIEGEYISYSRPEDMNFIYTGERFIFK